VFSASWYLTRCQNAWPAYPENTAAPVTCKRYDEKGSQTTPTAKVRHFGCALRNVFSREHHTRPRLAIPDARGRRRGRGRALRAAEIDGQDIAGLHPNLSRLCNGSAVLFPLGTDFIDVIATRHEFGRLKPPQRAAL
jgi:hypothetical protein